MIVGVTISNLVAKDSKKGTHEETGDGPMPKYRKILDKAVNLKSTSRGFKTKTIWSEHMNKLKKDSYTFTRKGKYLGMKKTKPFKF